MSNAQKTPASPAGENRMDGQQAAEPTEGFL